MSAGISDLERDVHLREACRLQSEGRFQESVAYLEEASRLSPKDLQTLVPLGYALIQLREWRRAAETFERIVLLLPKDHRVWCNLSYLYEHAGELGKAEDRARKAIRLSPQSAEAWNNLGMALRGRHRLSEAAQAFQQACVRHPGLALAEFNLATTWLLMGDTVKGWPGYEARVKLPEAALRVPLAPRWNGQPLSNGTLLVYFDQGLGDMMQFARLLPLAKERSGAQIVLSCPPALLTLMSTVRGADAVVPSNQEPAAATAEIAVSSLPCVLQIRLQEIPGTVPYLAQPSVTLSPPIREILADIPPATRKIGFVWQGNPKQGHDYVRSMPLRKLLPLAETPQTCWISLQVNQTGRDQLVEAESMWRVLDAGAHLTDFAETATLLKHLDLILTVDTSLAHLAGALGRPVWTMLGRTPDWRWGLHGETCPWYPTMRLFRQARWGDWDFVVTQVQQALADLD